LPRLQNTSMALALDAGMTKVAFKYIRHHISLKLQQTQTQQTTGEKEKQNQNQQTTGGGIIDERLVALFARLLVASGVAYDPAQWKNYSNSALSTSHRATAAASFSDYYKWAVRLLLSHPKCLTLMMLVGHLCVISAQYRTAAMEYERACRLVPTHPMPPLCAAVSHVSMAMSRTITNRHAWIAKAFVHMRVYRKLRLESSSRNEGKYALKAEIAYNEGRMFHQIGLLNHASKRYRNALKLMESYPDRCDINALRRSTTFNLAQIYRSSGNMKMARNLLTTIVI